MDPFTRGALILAAPSARELRCCTTGFQLLGAATACLQWKVNGQLAAGGSQVSCEANALRTAPTYFAGSAPCSCAKARDMSESSCTE